MKHGSFGISDIIIFFLMGLIIAALFLIFPLEPGADTTQKVIEPHTEKLAIISYLRSPLPKDLRDVNDDGEADATTVADLIGLGYTSESVREQELRTELTGTFKHVVRLEHIPEVTRGTAYAIAIKYPNGEHVRTGMLVKQANLVRLPLPDGKQVKIYYKPYENPGYYTPRDA